jgi:ankyrin repeat protein
LLVAVNKGDIEAARTVLRTTDPDAERDADGRTALAIAVLRVDVPLVKLLLASGANRLAVDRFGQTPVSYANASGDATVLQALGRP